MSTSFIQTATMIPAVSEWVFAPKAAEASVTVFPLSHQGKPIVVTLDATSPFDLSSVDPAHTRKSLSLRLSREWESQFECMEACLVHEVALRGVELLGDPAIEPSASYKSICKKNEQYPTHLRVKVNTTGGGKVRYWGVDKNRMDAPIDHAGCTWTVRIELRAVWVSGGSWGLVALATDLMLKEAEAVECPF